MSGLTDLQLLRYSRHILLPEVDVEGQERLLAGHALIIGAGGLGSPAALYLASAGVGRITICDDDAVDLTNLQRQIAHDTARIGMNKADSARQSMQALNPDITVDALPQRVAAADLAALLADVDVVLDCSDNFTTRHAINRACVIAKVPLVSGAAVRFDGQLAVFDSRDPDAPCYHCLFPEEGDVNDGPCATFGVFSPLVGVIGALQAAEALKLLIGRPSAARSQLLLHDALAATWRTLAIPQDPCCTVCSVK